MLAGLLCQNLQQTQNMQTVTNNHIHVLLSGDVYVDMHFKMAFSYLMFQTAAVTYVYIL